MKYKIIGFFAIISIYIVLNITPASAANPTLNYFINVSSTYESIMVIDYVNPSNNNHYYRVLLQSWNNWFVINNGYISGAWSTSCDVYGCSFDPLANPNEPLGWYEGSLNPSYAFSSFAILAKGNISRNNSTDNKYFPNYDDYLEFIKPKWYENVWNNFIDAIGSTGSGIADFFINLIDSIFGEDSERGPISHAVTIRNPTLAPTPTPIPYSTVVIPKTDIVSGETVYETNYYYVNPSGTPIVTSSPPVNSPTSGGGGGSSTEYYPINGDPYSLPYLDWLNNVDIGDSNYDGIDSIGDGLSAVDDIGSEYSDGMSAVQDSTGTLPTSWLLLIGIAAAIPLLAGIISRFLGG